MTFEPDRDNAAQEMTVAELIALLQTLPQHLPVAYRRCSEQGLLEARDIEVVRLCPPRADGWIQDARPDMDTYEYVLFPGN